MTTIIIEDEKPAARRLQRMLTELDVPVETMLHSVSESIQWLQEHPHPDVIFLDIQLSDGLSFEIFETLTVESAVIFTTAYDEYALKAFKLNSIDYLLKPIDDEELAAAIKKFQNLQAQNTNSTTIDLQSIQKLLAPTTLQKNFKKRFTIKVGQHLKIFNTEDIECFYSENKGTYLHTKENRNYLIDNTLEVLENELDPKIFYRISRKFYININAIQDIISYTNSRLQLKLNSYNEQEVIVSRERVKDFKEWLEK